MHQEVMDFILKYQTLAGDWVDKDKLPPDAQTCRGIWCLEMKNDGRLRARLVIDERSQVADVDLNESFYPPMPVKVNIRMLDVYAQSRDWVTEIFDIEKAFILSEVLTEARTRRNMWLQCPPGVFPEHCGKYMRVSGTLYGQRSAPADWYRTFNAYMLDYGLQRVDQDPCVYIKRNKHGKIMMTLVLHVDDGKVSGKRRDVD
jgi:hypothetical protein